MRRYLIWAAVSAVVVCLVVLVLGAPPAKRLTGGGVRPVTRTVAAYHGLGVWVDVFDWAPSGPGQAPVVTEDDVAVMAERGVRTIYLQAARTERADASGLVDADRITDLLAAAHAKDIDVVGWYLPQFADPAVDLARVQAIRRFDRDGQRFDGVALDIEWRGGVADAAERSRRLVDLLQTIDRRNGDEAVGAIVLPPVFLDTVSPTFWPGFPWQEMAGHVDVWLPMTYWTDRREASGLRDAGRYTDTSLQGLRQVVGDGLVVHPIGGVADKVAETDLPGFVAAAKRGGAVGGSIYDWRTTTEGMWASLAPLRRLPGGALGSATADSPG